jgi:type IV pilus assembly protein PilE
MPHAPTPEQGFTLVELMVTLTVASILAASAWPSLSEPVQRVRRLEAVEALQRASLAQERWRDRHQQPTGDLGPQGLRQTDVQGATSYVSASGRWRIDMQLPSSAPSPSPTVYTVTATAMGPRADPTCTSLRLVVTPTHVQHDATPTALRNRCWGY